MLGGADNPNGELPSYITGADIKTHTGAILVCLLLLCFASIARSRSFP